MPRPATPLALASLSVLALAGCAQEAPIIPVVLDLPARPARPVLAAEYRSVTPPARLADGRYATINAGLDADATVWHVRGALNVAALGCRGVADAGLVPAYNAMLTAKKAVLSRANAAVQARFRATAGKDWQNQADQYNTRLYNFFAMPAAKPGFCAAADAVASQVAATAPADFVSFAAAALPQLEAPFTAVYAAVDDYRGEVALWDQRFGAPPAIAAPAMAAGAMPAAPVRTAALR